MKLKIEIVANVKPQLGESPLWSVKEQRLYWVDIIGKRIFRSTESGCEIRCWESPQEIGCLAMRKSGGGVAGLKDGFYFVNFTTGEFEKICNPLKDAPENRFNDGKVDRSGRFLAGSMRQGSSAKGSAALYILDHDHSFRVVTKGFETLNGPCWTLDGSRIYFSDSEAGKVFSAAYDQSFGSIENQEPFVTTTLEGVPDGATIDSEGYYWQVRAFAGQIVRLDPSGMVDRVVEMPVKDITSLTFGGANMDVLFVTSMSPQNAPGRNQKSPLDGSVFAVRGLAARGIPEPEYTG